MATNTVSAVLFVKALHRVEPFYREILGANVLDRSDAHVSLECHGFHLMVHKIPDAMARSIEISTPPQRREQTAIRLDFPIADIALARTRAHSLGGHIDDSPPAWARDTNHIFLGYDPEGNVIGLMPAAAHPSR